MKLLTLIFSIFLAVMPALVCPMACCPVQSAQASERAPCHEASADSKDSGLMLVSDCMGVDFFVRSIINDVHPDQSVETFDVVWADLPDGNGLRLFNPGTPRGPPPSVGVTNVSLPVYFATQRFRI